MPDSGWQTLTTFTSVGLEGPWGNPDGAQYNDAANAYCPLDSGHYGSQLFCVGLNNPIPSGAIPTGIEMRFEVRDTGGGRARTHMISVIVNGAMAGTDKQDLTFDYPSSFFTVYFGGESDLWGLTDLTDTKVNANNFGIAIQCVEARNDGDTTVYIDIVEMKIHYSVRKKEFIQYS